MPGWGSRNSRMGGWSLSGRLGRVRIRGIGNVLVSGEAERGKNLSVDWTCVIERGMLAIVIDAEGR